MEIAPQHKVRRVKIIEVNEQWSYAKLEDGTTIKSKIVFLGAHIVIDENNKPVYNADGSPVYGVNHQQVTVIEAFEEVPKNTQRN